MIGLLIVGATLVMAVASLTALFTMDSGPDWLTLAAVILVKVTIVFVALAGTWLVVQNIRELVSTWTR